MQNTAENIITSIAQIALAIVGVAVIAVLVSRNSQTSGVLGAMASSLSRLLCVATGGTNCGTRTPIEDVNSTIVFH